MLRVSYHKQLHSCVYHVHLLLRSYRTSSKQPESPPSSSAKKTSASLPSSAKKTPPSLLTSSSPKKTSPPLLSTSSSAKKKTPPSEEIPAVNPIRTTKKKWGLFGDIHFDDRTLPRVIKTAEWITKTFKESGVSQVSSPPHPLSHLSTCKKRDEICEGESNSKFRLYAWATC
jgi:hypothetical protein